MQDEELENSTRFIPIIDKDKEKRVRRKLPLHGNEIKNSKIWMKQLNIKAQQRYVEESVLSAVYESGATSIYRTNNDELILTDEQSNKVFHMPTGTTTKESVNTKMNHNLR